MTYGVVVNVSIPVEAYDALHHKLLELTGAEVEGLLAHVGRATDTGFQVIEVWDSKEQSDRYNQEVVWPLAAELSAGQPMPEQTTEEFGVRGLVIPGAGIAL